MSYHLVVNGYYVLNIPFINLVKSILFTYRAVSHSSIASGSKIRVAVALWSNSYIDSIIGSINGEIGTTTLDSFIVSNTADDTNRCLASIQQLINQYTVGVEIAKAAITNLLCVMDLLCKIDTFGLSVTRPIKSKFTKKVRNIGNYIFSKISDFIYREFHLVYLSHRRDSKINAYVVPHVSLALYPSSGTLPSIDILSLSTYIRNANDLHSLMLVNREFNHVYNTNTIRSTATVNLRDIVQHVYGLSFNALNTIIRNSRMIISGSSTLESLYGNVVETEADMDIYLEDRNSSFEVLDSFIVASGYIRISISAPDVPNYYSSAIQLYRYDEHIDRVYNYRNDRGRRIQVIVTTKSNCSNNFLYGLSIVKRFDLSFVMNFYDGNTFHIHDLDGVIGRYGSVSSTILSKCTYTSDGGLTQDLNKWFKESTATSIRCIKYQGRRYDISNVPSSSIVTLLNITD